MPRIYSDSEDEVRSGARSRSPPPRGIFSDDDDDSDRGRRHSEAEEDNSYNRTEGGVGGGGGNGDINTDEDEEEERKRAEKKRKEEERKKKPKGPVRRQMISEDMLTGKKGVSVIPGLFEDFKFGGKGKERQDIERILSKLEHWIHLLHPRQPFDQCLNRIEFLGQKKKIVKVHLKKIRMGMLDENFGTEEFVNEEDEEENNGEMETVGEEATAFPETLEATAMVGTSSGLLGATGGGVDISEFPDDDDEFFEMAEEATQKKSGGEMEIDEEDIPRMEDDEEEEDDFMRKMMEMAKRREEESAEPEKVAASDDKAQEKEVDKDVEMEQPEVSIEEVSQAAVEEEEAVTDDKAVVEDNTHEENPVDMEATERVTFTEMAEEDDGIDLDDLRDEDSD